MMRPKSRVRIRGSASWMIRSGAVRLTASGSSGSSFRNLLSRVALTSPPHRLALVISDWRLERGQRTNAA